MGVTTTQVTVQFDDAAFSTGAVVLERSNREPELDSWVFFRAHGLDGHALFSTSGSISRVTSSLTRYTVEFLSFSGNSEVSIQYPNARNLTMQIQGGLYNGTGERIGSPTLEYNPVSRTIGVKDQSSVQGVILATYDAPYELWLAKFAGACPTVEPNAPPLDLSRGGADDDVYVEGREPMLIMAWKQGVLDATLQLEPPECRYDGENSVGGQRQQDAQLPKLVIEEDPDRPLRLIGSAGNFLAAGGYLRVYPGDPDISLSVTEGELRPDKFVKKTRSVTETIQLSGRSSAQLRYPPSSNTKISAKTIGGVVDQWGRKADIDLRVYGESITSVEWISRNSYSSPIRRSVFTDEVAVANMFGVATPIYGSIEVEYITDYWLAEYTYVYDREEREFTDAWAVASRGVEVANLSLKGPTTRGNR